MQACIKHVNGILSLCVAYSLMSFSCIGLYKYKYKYVYVLVNIYVSHSVCKKFVSLQNGIAFILILVTNRLVACRFNSCADIVDVTVIAIATDTVTVTLMM